LIAAGNIDLGLDETGRAAQIGAFNPDLIQIGATEFNTGQTVPLR
jgi:hypothetical protein